MESFLSLFGAPLGLPITSKSRVLGPSDTPNPGERIIGLLSLSFFKVSFKTCDSGPNSPRLPINHPSHSPLTILLSTESMKLPSSARRYLYDSIKTTINSVLSAMPPDGIESLHRLRNGNLGGVYLLNNAEGRIAAVFKPLDEEVSEEMRGRSPDVLPIVRKGGGAVREVAAFLLSREFANVPATSMVRLKVGENGVKTGALQAYIPNFSTAADVSHVRFGEKCTDDIHRIGALDIRFLNRDRNESNILCIQSRNESEDDSEYSPRSSISGSSSSSSVPVEIDRLVPIDHGLILPETGNISTISDIDWCWLSYPQAKLPFSVETKEEILKWDVSSDATLLLSMSVEKEAVRTMIASTIFLQKAVAAGYTLFEIANSVVRPYGAAEPSALEVMITTAIEQMEGESLEEFRAVFEKEVDNHFTV